MNGARGVLGVAVVKSTALISCYSRLMSTLTTLFVSFNDFINLQTAGTLSSSSFTFLPHSLLFHPHAESLVSQCYNKSKLHIQH